MSRENQRHQDAGFPPRSEYRSGRDIVRERMPSEASTGGRNYADGAQSEYLLQSSWDSDAQFSSMELDRIRRKTQMLRTSRDEAIFRTNDNSSDGQQNYPIQHSHTSGTGGTGASPVGSSARKKESKAWSGDVSRASASTGRAMESVSTRNGDSSDSKGEPSPSQVAQRVQQSLIKKFNARGVVRSRESVASVETPVNTSEPSTVDSTQESDKNLTLHDLCGEATSTDDIAWRNALYLLSVQPHLASVTDQGWTPLHICCMGDSPPPSFMVRALLYVNRQAARSPDDGGRLPLHLVAASSADATTMQLLVEEYSEGICQVDEHGLTPLHLLLRNVSVELREENSRVLLGLTIPREERLERNRRHLLLRRGEHLNLRLDELDQLLKRSPPATALHRDAYHEAEFELYPADVQLSLRKLSQWKRKQVPEDDAVEVLAEIGVTNPAAIPSPVTLELPIHTVIRRALVDRTSLEINEEYEQGHEKGNDPIYRPSVPDIPRVLRTFIVAFPESLQFRDADGLTPSLLTLTMRESVPSLDIVELLLGKRSPEAEALPDWAQDVPYHSLIRFGFKNPAMIPTGDMNQLPLHLAAEEFLGHQNLIFSIYSAYPGAIHVQDVRGRTPLHLALQNYRKTPVDPQILALLLSDQVAQTRDDSGKLPFDLLLESANNLPPWEPKGNVDLRLGAVADGSTVYKKFVNLSLVGTGQPWNFTEAINLLARVRTLPRWLRRDICGSVCFQNLILEELASPWFCFFILLDGLALVALIVFFRLQMKNFVDTTRSDVRLSRWYTYAVYASACFRLSFRASYVSVMIVMGKFQRSIIVHSWLWIDITTNILAFTTSALLYGSYEDDFLLALGTITTAFLWFAAFGYLATWFHGMAIFKDILSRLMFYILWPIFSFGILIVAFAQMIYTLFQMDCENSLNDMAVCSVRDAYKVAYLLARGEALASLRNGDDLSPEAIIMVAAFLLFLFLLIAGSFAIIVVVCLYHDNEDVVLSSFWEPKLDLMFSFGQNNNRKGRKGVGLQQKLEDSWDFLMSCLVGTNVMAGENWNYRPRSSVTTALVGLLSILLLPLWVVLGALTLGLFWPPQLRRLLFRPALRPRRSKAVQEVSAAQSGEMKCELHKLKNMVFQRTGELHEEVTQVRRIFSSIVKEE